MVGTVKQRYYMNKIDGVRDFLKYNYISHFSSDDDDTIHNVHLKLLDGVSSLQEMVKFTEFLYLYAVLEEMKDDFAEKRSELDVVIDDSKNKIKFNTGHI